MRYRYQHLLAGLSCLALVLLGGCGSDATPPSSVALGGACTSTTECSGEMRCIYNTCVEIDENGTPLPGPDGKPLVNACGAALCGVDIFGNSCGGCGVDAPLCVAGVCVESEGCSDIDNDGTADSGFQPTAEAALIRRVGGKHVVRFVATSRSKSPPFDKVVVEINHASLEEKGLSATGTFDIGGDVDSLKTCDHCVTAYTYCNTTGCFNEYYVESGEIEVIQAGTPGTTMEVKLKGLKLREFRRGNDGKPKAFNNGKTWCMGDYAFQVLVPEIKQAEGFCVADGTGKNVQDNIADFPMMNCYGEPVNLHDQCALSKAVWVVYTTGW